MKVLILKNNLKEGLRNVERIAGKNIHLPILENVLLEAEKSYLVLTTTDLETAIKCWVLAKVEKGGAVAVPAKFLAGYINSLDLEKLNLAEEGNFLELENKNFQAKLKTFPSNDFPPLPSFDEKDAIEVNAAPFIEGLKQVVETASFSQAKPEISGVLIIINPDFVKLVATDSFRLAEKTLFFGKKEKRSFSFIVPQRAIRELINILADKKGKLIIYFSKTQVIFESQIEEITQPRIQVFSRLIEGEYPDYQEIIPQKYETQLTLSRLTFLNQIKAAGLFSGKINELKVKTDPKKKEVELFSQSPDLGENKSSLPAVVKGKKTEASFNWRFLADGLGNIKSPEVIFELNGEEGPALLKPLGDESYFYIVMPIKAS